jgi:alkylation response protein AidB-like acyl-CoA dehydrogenase
MFNLADMMTYVEVGAAFARKAIRMTEENAPAAEKFKAMARVFAGEVAHMVGEGALKVIMADESADQSAIDQFLSDVGYQEMLSGRANWLKDMDRVADFIFER